MNLQIFSPNMIKKMGRVIGINSVCGSEVTKEDRPWFVGAKAYQSYIKVFFKKK